MGHSVCGLLFIDMVILINFKGALNQIQIHFLFHQLQLIKYLFDFCYKIAKV